MNNRAEHPDPSPRSPSQLPLQAPLRIPRRPRRLERLLRGAAGLAAACLLLDGAAALAQSNPKFEFVKKSDADKAVWKASASGGALLATGNANSYTINASGSVARVDPKNKIALDMNIAWGRSTTPILVDMNNNMAVDDASEIGSETKDTTKQWNVKLRYDRFFTPHNVGYLSTLVGGNELAGKPVFGNVQLGYARQLYQSDRNELFLEVGYDFTYEFYKYPHDPEFNALDATGMPVQNSLQIHSLRLFFGHNLKLTPDTGLFTGVESLFNLNPLKAPGFDEQQGAFRDIRVNFKTALNTKLYKSLSFRFTFTALFDNVPAPRTLPGLTLGGERDPNDPTKIVKPFVPVSQKLDTLSEAALVVTFL